MYVEDIRMLGICGNDVREYIEGLFSNNDDIDIIDVVRNKISYMIVDGESYIMYDVIYNGDYSEKEMFEYNNYMYGTHIYSDKLDCRFKIRINPVKKDLEVGDMDYDESIEWDKWDRPVLVAYDLDGTIIEKDVEWKGNDHFNDVLDGVREFLDWLDDMNGVDVMIWTCRNNSFQVCEFMYENSLSFDYINGSPYEPKNVSRKAPYDILVDDHDLVQFMGSYDDKGFKRHLEKSINGIKTEREMCKGE